MSDPIDFGYISVNGDLTGTLECGTRVFVTEFSQKGVRVTGADEIWKALDKNRKAKYQSFFTDGTSGDSIQSVTLSFKRKGEWFSLKCEFMRA